MTFEQRTADCSVCGAKDEIVFVPILDRGETIEEGEARCDACFFIRPHAIVEQEIEHDEAKPRRVVSKARRKRVARQEAEMAETVGGRTQAGSGAVAGCKGDVRKKGLFRIECKSTENQSFSMKREILDKIRSECGRNELPALDVLFLNHTTYAEEDRWVAIPFTQFEGYAEYVASNNRRSLKG
jgi:hypothetical protein